MAACWSDSIAIHGWWLSKDFYLLPSLIKNVIFTIIFCYSESTTIRAGVKRSHTNEEEGGALGEVVCTMNDVIMIEDGQCATGTVLKVCVLCM